MSTPDGGPGGVDVAVVGAGPAGMAAAVAAAEAGLRVAVVDTGSQPGGQYWRHRDESLAVPDVPGRSGEAADFQAGRTGRVLARRPPGDKTYARLRDRFESARAAGSLDYLPGSQVWFIEPGMDRGSPYRLRLTGVSDLGPSPERRLVSATALILCPGGYDRQLPIPGWDLPGVMAAGGVQALLKGSGTLAGRRAVVAGTGPFLLPVAIGLAAAGAEVAAVCEAGAIRSWLPRLGGALRVPSKGVEALGYAARLARHRVSYRTRTAITAVHGTDEVTAVTIARVDADGRVRSGAEQRLAVDLVALGWGFTPSTELVVAVGADTRLDVDGSLVAVVDGGQRTTAARVYAAGEVTGVGGAALAVLEGELAGLTAAQDLRGGADSDRRYRLRRAIGRARRFAAAMHRAHPVPRRWDDWLTPDTIVCRCEEVTFADLVHARDELGAGDPRTVKMLSRVGMGWCQGRVCGFAAALLAEAGRAPTAADLRSVAKRSLCAPVALSELVDLTEPAGPTEPGTPDQLDHGEEP